MNAGFAWRLLGTGLLWGAAAALPSGQRATGPRLVEPFAFEFLALGPDGTPVRDLAPDEVQLKLDGRERRIHALEFVPIFAARASDGTPMIPLPPPFGTNTAFDGTRSVLLVVDDHSFRPGLERVLRQSIQGFLSSLGPRDQVAVVTVPYGGLKTDLTTEHERALIALSSVVGQAPRGESGSDLACRTRRTLESLTGLFESLGGGEGPTTVLFFSSRLAGPRRDAAITLAPGACELTVDHFRRAGAAASAARAHFYLIQPDDVMLSPGANQTEGISGSGFAGSDNPLEGLEHLAGVTGGHRLHVQTPEDMVLARVSRETEGYYLLQFDLQASDREGMRRRVGLRVSRPHVTVRARPEFTVPPTAPAGKPPTPSTILRSGRVFRGLPLRATAYVSRSPEDGRTKVVAIIEPLEAKAAVVSASAALISRDGRVAAQWNAADTESRPLVGALTVPPGQYRLRVAATGADGRAGSADYEIRAELTPAGPLSLSGLALGLSRGTSFEPRLDFGAEASAVGYLEIYGQPGSEPMGISFELAKTSNGRALVTTPGVIEATRWPGHFIGTGAVPIQALPPGDYIVRAVAGVKGQPAGRVVRTLRKVSTPNHQLPTPRASNAQTR